MAVLGNHMTYTLAFGLQYSCCQKGTGYQNFLVTDMGKLINCFLETRRNTHALRQCLRHSIACQERGSLTPDKCFINLQEEIRVRGEHWELQFLKMV